MVLVFGMGFSWDLQHMACLGLPKYVHVWSGRLGNFDGRCTIAVSVRLAEDGLERLTSRMEVPRPLKTGVVFFELNKNTPSRSS